MINVGIHDGHGSSATLLVDGKVKAVIEEERLVREKGCSGYPKNAVGHLKLQYPEEMLNIDGVAIVTIDHDFSLFATKRYPQFNIHDHLEEERLFWVPTLLKGEKLDYLKVMAHKVNLDND